MKPIHRKQIKSYYFKSFVWKIAFLIEAIESIKNLGTHMNETLKLADVSNEAYQMILKDYGILEHKK